MSDVAISTTASSDLKVIEGLELKGQINTPADVIADHIRVAIRQGHPQVRPQAPTYDRVCMVGGGPSLAATEPELVALVRDGAKVVTVNGAYHWCLARNLFPKAQLVMDARPGNARFLEPYLPSCHYLVASQCHPEVWPVVAGREKVWLFHAVTADETHAQILTDYYQGQWQSVNGGSTSAHRALVALRILGHLRFDLFGVDCCWMGEAHHAYPQPENDGDRYYRVTVAPSEAPDQAREFVCSGWHLKAYEDWLKVIRVSGSQFVMHVHGDGLLAYTLATNAALVDTQEV